MSSSRCSPARPDASTGCDIRLGPPAGISPRRGGRPSRDPTTARGAGLTELLEGGDVDSHPEIAEMVGELAKALLADDDKLLADARPVPAS